MEGEEVHEFDDENGDAIERCGIFTFAITSNNSIEI